MKYLFFFMSMVGLSGSIFPWSDTPNTELLLAAILFALWAIFYQLHERRR